ncbi:outer membrane beta-barrel family protein [Zobellia alginiliquefaciens]|uniref:outer membrane beta-barrel family protein n=1 Tax=Zobellia alginiliquefaciens TaxID=3032586 RepID=UPI0023E3FC8A|nr:outer membrane beta-barrel family protein [Zobellia alginiliquefaciens]
MKKLICPLLFLLSFNSLLYSQDYVISGTVKSREDVAVSFANVLLLKATDSSLVNGTSTDEDGTFKIKGIIAGNYLIKASFIGNESAMKAFQLESDTEIGSLILNDTDQRLDEVVVTSSKPRLEKKIDRLVFNIENTAYADGDVWDVLKITPSVMVINNKLTIKGSSEIGVLINGRKVNIPYDDIVNLLSGTSAANVQNIEVITNPPAKYSAENDALINIVMKKNIVAGYNGAVYNKYVQGVLPKHTVGTNHFFKGKKTQLSLNYSFQRDRDVIYYTDITNFVEDDNVSTWTEEQEYLNNKKQHNLSLFFDYDISEKTRLSFTTITLWQPNRHRTYDTETDVAGDDQFSRFLTLNNSEIQNLNTSYYIDYIHDLNEKGAQLSFNAHYTYYDENKDQLIESTFYNTDGVLFGNNDFTTDSEQEINLYSVQGDYESPIGKSGSFGTGLRYAGISSKSTIDQQGFDRDQPGIDPSEAGAFDYDESIYAAYVSYSGKWDKWKAKTGLRAEYAETEGELETENTSNERNNFQLFPSFSIQYLPNKKHNFDLYYFRKITRPRYNDINPFQTFQSTFSTIEGNPELKPSTRYYIAGGYTYDKSYTVELFYKKAKNVLSELIFQNNDNNLLQFISSNVNQESSYGIDFSISKDFTNFYNCYLLTSFYSETFRFTNISTNSLVELDQLGWFVRNSNSFSFLSDRSLTVDLNLIYTTAMLSGNTKVDAFGALNLMVRKTLYDRNLSLSLGIEDIFNQGNQFKQRNYQDQNGTSLKKGENRLLVMGLRYKFGNSKMRDNQKSKRVDERNRI